jgi:uncharacterized membrane-anchored protein
MHLKYSKSGVLILVGAAALLAASFSWEARMNALLPIALAVGGIAIILKALRWWIERRS